MRISCTGIVQGIFFFSFWCLSFLSFAQECDLKRETEGIKVYTCKEENERFKSLKAEFELRNTSFQTLKEFLWDVNNYVTWQYNMIESETISSSGSNEIVYRSVVDAPWPVENRELVVKINVKDESNPIKIFIHSVPYEKATPNGTIRVPLFDASWTIKEENKILRVVYALRIDPGGSVPAWLANLALADGPYISFKKLKEQIEK